jgi:adenylate kinase
VLILFGPPGSGKGTQAVRLASALDIPAISTGEILRSECQSGSLLGRELATMLSSGQLVNDGLVSEVVARRIQNADCASGCILDGYPRTVSQARFLDELLMKLGMPSPTVLDFVVSPREVLARLERRRQCARCGRIVSVETRETGLLVCELDGAPLIRRADDHVGAIRERLRFYRQNAGELVRYYRKRRYCRVRANRSPDEVTSQIFAALKLSQPSDVVRAPRTLSPRAAY